MLYPGEDNKCMMGDIRLVGGVDNSSSGVVEVCVNGLWGTLCDYRGNWLKNVVVICRQLHLPTSSMEPLAHSY